MMELPNILDSLKTFNVNLSKLRGQAYDGAANMSGATKGAASIITAQYPLALYLHCVSHCLNLAVVKSLQLTSKYPFLCKLFERYVLYLVDTAN